MPTNPFFAVIAAVALATPAAAAAVDAQSTAEATAEAAAEQSLIAIELPTGDDTGEVDSINFACAFS
ncbi:MULTISPECIES: hypothetical protein [unclassified Solwaraspora]|uniref:hypothetical protein n=1 Tax=unclassified Solwaraspora TaxID=2627926 RepID=UPI00259B07DD|nr:hypothetical protein [Solwaraspora sp. WMMA2056]WJK40058.1 hypothetical protein O7608_27140 [Solwaraspora sp. WMMA2056]